MKMNPFIGSGPAYFPTSFGTQDGFVGKVSSNRTLLQFDMGDLNFNECFKLLKEALKDHEIRAGLKGVMVREDMKQPMIKIDDVYFLEVGGKVQADTEGQWTPEKANAARDRLSQMHTALNTLQEIRKQPDLFGEAVGKPLLSRDPATGAFEINFVAEAQTEQALAKSMAEFTEVVTAR